MIFATHALGKMINVNLGALASSSSLPSANPLSKAYKRLTNMRSKGKVPPPEQNVFWFQGQSSAPPKNYTPGMHYILDIY